MMEWESHFRNSASGTAFDLLSPSLLAAPTEVTHSCSKTSAEKIAAAL